MSLYKIQTHFFIKDRIIADQPCRFSVRIVKIHLNLCKKNKGCYNFAAKMGIAYKRREKHGTGTSCDCNLVEPNLSKYFLKDVEDLIRISGPIIKTIKEKSITKSFLTPNSRIK